MWIKDPEPVFFPDPDPGGPIRPDPTGSGSATLVPMFLCLQCSVGNPDPLKMDRIRSTAQLSDISFHVW